MDAYPVPGDLQAKAICGLEIDSHHRGHTAHLLGYGIEQRGSALLEALSLQRADRRGRMQQMVDQLRSLGLNLCLDDVIAHAPGASSLGRPHLARALVAKGHAESVQDAFDRYLADDATAYVALERLSAQRIIDLIHAGSGVAIVAHPLRLRDPEDLSELIELGVDGIEVVHPTASPAQEAELREIARRHGLLVTGGTDFHAPVPGRPLGIELADSEVHLLLERIAVRA